MNLKSFDSQNNEIMIQLNDEERITFRVILDVHSQFDSMNQHFFNE